MTKIIPRDYQQTILENVRCSLASGKRRPLVVSATGSGKTVVFSAIAASAAERGNNVLILAHRDQLIKQASRKLRDYGVRHGIIMAGFTPDMTARVQVASVQTLVRRLGKFKWQPKLIIIDECLHGDSVIHTDVGQIPIRDVPTSGARMVLSFDGSKDVWMPISAFADKGVRSTLRVSYPGGSIVCTGNHLFFTRSGWKRADQLTALDQVFVPADAVGQLRSTNGAMSANGFRATESGSGWKSTGTRGLPLSKPTGRSAPVGVASWSSPDSKAQKTCAATGHHLDATPGTSLAINAGPKGSNTKSVTGKFRLFLGRYSGMQAFCSLIERRSILACPGTTDQSKLPGQTTKPNFSAALPSSKGRSKTKATGWFPSVGRHRAIQFFSTFTESALPTARKPSLKTGWTRSARLAWLGGIATMATTIQRPGSRTSTSKVSTPIRRKLSAAGWTSDSTGQSCNQPVDGGSFGCGSVPLSDCSMKSASTSPSSSPTRWLPVLSVSEDSESRVYDIQVDQTECFYANGVLVHNCHLSAAKSYLQIIDHFSDARVIGFTGSPCRLDGKPLGLAAGGIYDDLIQAISIRQLIDRGFLVQPVVYAPAEQLDLSSVHMSKGDFDVTELAAVVDRPQITGSAVAHYQRICPGEPAVAWCVNLAHAEHVAAEFNAQGIQTMMLSGEDDSDTRDKALRALETGRVQVITFVGILIEGVDCPAISAIILLRPTMSLSSYLQVIGRGLRPHTFPDGRKKTRCVVLDHAGLTFKHGLADEERDWSLDDEEAKKPGKKKNPAERNDVIQCVGPNGCYGVWRIDDSPLACPHCGNPVPVKTGRELQHAEGELTEITPEMAEAMRNAKRREVKGAKTLEELQRIAAERGYSPGWARATFEAKQRTKQKYQRHAGPPEPTLEEMKSMTLEQLTRVAREQGWPHQWPSEFYHSQRNLGE